MITREELDMYTKAYSQGDNLISDDTIQKGGDEY